MPDNILTRDRADADLDIAAKEIGAVKFPRNILVDPSGADIDPATEATLAALLSAVQSQQTGLTNTELRAAPLAVTGTFYQATQPVSFTWAGLTDAQLRAAPVGVSVSGTVPVSGTFWQATQPVSFTWAGLTDSQLRASAVPVSVGNFPATQAVSGTFWQATQPVSFTWAGLTDAQLRAAAVPVSAASLPLPNGAATEATIAAVNAKLPSLSSGRIPVELPPGGGGLTDAELRAAPVPVSQVSPFFWRVGFAEVGAGLQGLAAIELSLLKTGSGMTVNQSGGNLVVTTGTTVNAETVFRSVDTFRGALLARYQMILSQRIVNQTFRVELADLIGDGLDYTINSATSVTVTIPGTTLTAANVGQSMRLAALSSVGIPGRYAIASVSGTAVTFTVTGWPASGSGTLTLYGHNWMAAEYSGTVATNAFIDAQRRGWASGNTTATINTTASPGHVGQIAFDVMSMGYADALAASNIGFQWTPRASRITNIPDEDVELYLFLVVQNGSVAPASTTTATIGFMSVEDQPRNKVRVSGADPSTSSATPVQIMGGAALATQPVTGTVTATVTGGTVSPVVPATPYILNSAASENAALILTGTSGLHAFYATNTGATVAFVKLYNKATAPISTDIPAMVIPVPAAVSGVPGVAMLPIGFAGFRFALGLGIRITGAVADNDTTAVTAGQVKVMLSRTV